MPRRVIVIPDGGGRRDPRYAAESSSRNASSYPPSNPLSSTARRGRTGWEPNPYGEFPGDARASSMVNYNDRGYETRAEPFPSRSPMGRQYRDYKNISKKAETASRTYKDHRRALSPKIPSKREPISEADKRSHQELGKLACFAGTSYESTSLAREKFNQDHIGRRTKDSYMGHREAATNAHKAARDYARKANEHRRFGM